MDGFFFRLPQVDMLGHAAKVIVLIPRGGDSVQDCGCTLARQHELATSCSIDLPMRPCAVFVLLSLKEPTAPQVNRRAEVLPSNPTETKLEGLGALIAALGAVSWIA